MNDDSKPKKRKPGSKARRQKPAQWKVQLYDSSSDVEKSGTSLQVTLFEEAESSAADVTSANFNRGRRFP